MDFTSRRRQRRTNRIEVKVIGTLLVPFLILWVEAFTLVHHLSVPDGSGSLKIGNHKILRRTRKWGWGPFLDFTSRKRQRRTNKIEVKVIGTLRVPFLILGVDAFTLLHHLSVIDDSGSLKTEYSPNFCKYIGTILGWHTL